MGMQELLKDSHRILTIFPCLWDRSRQPSKIDYPHTTGGTRGDPRRCKWHTCQGKTGAIGRIRKKTGSCNEAKLKVPARMAKAYEPAIHLRIFTEGQLVLRVTEHVRKNIQGPSKFTSKWEDPYAVKETHDNEYYYLARTDETLLANPTNEKWLKQYYTRSSGYPRHLLSSFILLSTSIILHFRHYYSISFVIRCFEKYFIQYPFHIIHVKEPLYSWPTPFAKKSSNHYDELQWFFFKWLSILWLCLK